MKTLLHMARHEIMPAIANEWKFAAEANRLENPPTYLRTKENTLREILDDLNTSLTVLEDRYLAVQNLAIDTYDCASYVYEHLVPQLEVVRSHIDRYESIASDEFYHLPTYTGMLFAL